MDPEGVPQSQRVAVGHRHGIIEAQAAAHPAVVPHVERGGMPRIAGVVEDRDAPESVRVIRDPAGVIAPGCGPAEDLLLVPFARGVEDPATAVVHADAPRHAHADRAEAGRAEGQRPAGRRRELEIDHQQPVTRAGERPHLRPPPLDRDDGAIGGVEPVVHDAQGCRVGTIDVISTVTMRPWRFARSPQKSIPSTALWEIHALVWCE